MYRSFFGGGLGWGGGRGAQQVLFRDRRAKETAATPPDGNAYQKQRTLF